MKRKPVLTVVVCLFVLLAFFLLALFLPMNMTYANHLPLSNQSKPSTSTATINLTEKLTVTSDTSSDYFGNSVSLSQNMVLIGAPEDKGHDFKSGVAYIFCQDGLSWQEDAKLMATDGRQNDQFGFSVSLSGQKALIGAYGDDELGSDSGSAYIYRWDGKAWQEEPKLLASDGSEDDWFAYSVALDGEVALIGAPNAQNGSGVAYIFRWNGSTWVEEAKLRPKNGIQDEQFAYSVALSGDVALIGAFQNDEFGNNSGSGAAYLYRFDGNSWQQEQTLLPRDGAAGDHFGNAVALSPLSPNLALIGAYWDDGRANDSGSAYLFRWDGQSWQQEQKLIASDPIQSANFGNSLALTENMALIGAPGGNGQRANSGSAYLYQWDGSRWQETEKLIASDAAPDDKNFAYSVSLSTQSAFIGAPDYDDGVSSGVIYHHDDLPANIIRWRVSGQIRLQRPIQAHEGSHIRLTGSQGNSFETLTAQDGTFTFHRLPPDHYELIASHNNHLSYEQTSITVNSATTISPITLCAGDMDQNGHIDRQDQEQMVDGIIKEYKPSYDLNGDGETNVVDLIIVQQNLGKSAPTDCTD